MLPAILAASNRHASQISIRWARPGCVIRRKPPLDPSNERLVGVLLHPRFAERLVDDHNGAPEAPPRGSQNHPIVMSYSNRKRAWGQTGVRIRRAPNEFLALFQNLDGKVAADGRKPVITGDVCSPRLSTGMKSPLPPIRTNSQQHEYGTCDLPATHQEVPGDRSGSASLRSRRLER
jgi:hypothetical protein